MSGIDDHGIQADYPLLYQRSLAFDYAERLGGSTDDEAREIDTALRELWDARRTRQEQADQAPSTA